MSVRIERELVHQTAGKHGDTLRTFLAIAAVGVQGTIEPCGQLEVGGMYVKGPIRIGFDTQRSPVGQHDSAGARIPAAVGRIVLESGDENLVLSRINWMDFGRACNQPAMGIVFHPLGHRG